MFFSLILASLLCLIFLFFDDDHRDERSSRRNKELEDDQETASSSFSWTHLPLDLLWTISRMTGDVADLVRFSAVCKDWRSAAWPKSGEYDGTHISMELQWLLFPETHLGFLKFYSSVDGKIYTHRLPEAFGKYLCGFSHEWLALFDPLTHRLSLLHPLTRVEIPLPPISWSPTASAAVQDEGDAVEELPPDLVSGCADQLRLLRRLDEYVKRFVRKVNVSSANPMAPDFVVMAILGDSRRYAVCRPVGGEGAGWTVVDPKLSKNIMDITYLHGVVHANCDMAAYFHSGYLFSMCYLDS